MSDLAPTVEEGDDLREQVFRLWVDAELLRRGLGRDDVQRALVLMTDPLPTVQLNAEFEVIATGRTTRAITAGEVVTDRDFSEITGARPTAVDPDLGWILYVIVGPWALVTFDLRANCGWAGRMLDLAEDFVSTAEEALASLRLGPAVDCALSAAELAVKAQTYLLGQTLGQHRQRLQFWTEWVRHGNAPAELAETFVRLTDARGAARYADSPLRMGRQDIEHELTCVRTMIEVARAHVDGRTTSFTLEAG